MKSRLVNRRALRRTVLGLERLEARETPAGVVAANLINNTLSFVGDGNAAGNEVRVTAIANNHFEIEGLNGTTFTVNKIAVGNKIDTSLVPNFTFPNNGTTKIDGKFLGGPDRFEFDGFSRGQLPRQFGDVLLNMGAGNDTVLATQFIAKSVTINSTLPTVGNTDNDAITIAAGGALDLDAGIPGTESYAGGINKNLTIMGQSGSDTTVIAATIGGNVTGTFMDAGDSLTIRGGSRIGGNLTVTETPAKLLGKNTLAISENTQIGLNVNFNNTVNAADVDVLNSSIGGNLMLNSGSGTAGSTFDLLNVLVGGNLDVKGGTLADTFFGQGVVVAKNLSVSTGDGGNGGMAVPDALLQSRVAGNATFTYGKGNHSLSVLNTNVFGNVSATTGDGLDTLNYDNGVIGKNFSYTGGTGGNGGGANPDSISNLTVGGTFSVTYGSGDENLSLGSVEVHGTSAIRTGDGVNSVHVTGALFLGTFSVTGGLGIDTVNLRAIDVIGTTSINTSGGSDLVNITQFGRFKGKVTFNLGGAGTDNDDLTVNADAGLEIVFLGGVSVATGAGTDTTTIGTSAGNVILLNGLTYAEAAALTDTFNAGVNLVIL